MNDSFARRLLIVMLGLAFVGSYPLVMDGPTPWPPALKLTLISWGGLTFWPPAPARSRLFEVGPVAWPKVNGTFMQLADGPGPVPWPTVNGSSRQVADGPGPVPWPTVGRVSVGSAV